MKVQTALAATLLSVALNASIQAAPQAAAPGASVERSVEQRQQARAKRIALLRGLNPQERVAVVQLGMVERALRDANRQTEVRAFYVDALNRTRNANVRSLIELRLLRLDTRGQRSADSVEQLKRTLEQTLARLP
jgi:hypothetical protein